MSNGLISISEYRYDKGEMLKSLHTAAMDRISNITYNPRGQRENVYYGNNTKTRYYYNPLNFRLTRILTTRNNGQDILQDLNYSYDSVGNITSQTDNAQQTFYFNNQVIAPTGSYQYDALYRLLQATGRELLSLGMPTHNDFINTIHCPNPASNAMQNYTQYYSYDTLGNILNVTSQGSWSRDYIYATATNRLLRHTQQLPDTYSYDAHGNMLVMPHLSNMSWDYLDQLHSATNGTFVSYYNYDAEGNRTRKVTEKGNITEIRYYIGNYELSQKYVNDSLDFERTTLNISDDEKVFVRIETKTGENPVIRYQYDNHLGSACLELDNSGQIISYEEYHPFGTTSYRSGRTETEVSLKRYKYCGKERDEETGLYYYGMRYYAAWLCRFVSVDPLQFQYPYYTPYQYAGNKPVSYIDLDGGEPLQPQTQTFSFSFENYSQTDYTSNGSSFQHIEYSYGDLNIIQQDQTLIYNYQTFQCDATYRFVAPTNSWNLVSYNTIQKSAFGEIPLSSNSNYQVEKNNWQAIDYVQTGLDVLGLIPGIGEFFDLANAGIYAYRGDYVNAGMSLMAVIPIFGMAATAGKAVNKGVKAAEMGLKATEVATTGVQYTKSTLQLGQQMHKAYKVGDVVEGEAMKEFRGIPGIRPDFVDFRTKTIYELKPFNPRAMQQGWNQLNKYQNLFQQTYGGTWKIILDPY